MSIPIVTCFFVGLLAIMQVPMTVMVGYRRLKTGIQFLDGGDVVLLRRMRAHANFTETVPMVLLAMAAAEITGLPAWALWTGGASLVIGRLLHAVILVRHGWGNGRAFGMLMTFAPMLGFGAWSVYRSLF
ncbi:hypothetical protein C7S18_03660 [Ahniella affigens]|uniref:MAPEG family protein n=1 Tax=Ahniella affigens TaxID=2021234 RepID=A0A2P1PNB3_9GAMM|nr:MAPEG family protein [Ahniella affigens]AVP96340.1 hypothetical protein C7S18_03660 [Ahniella affigens]